jgi:amidophosphoribosyltransferase
MEGDILADDFLVDGDILDRPREACGVFGIYAPDTDVARTTFFALYALQHRGQESAGIATSDGISAALHKDMGLVAQVFTESNLTKLQGHLAIGQTRYSTTGSSHLRNAQPHVIETMHGPLGVGHNGNLTNAPELRQQLLARGVGLTSTTDSEVITQMLAAPAPGAGNGEADWEARLANFMAEAEGAYSLVVLTRNAVYGIRDPQGFRPLCIGKLPEGGYVLASESCALGTVSAAFVREVEPGEIIRLDAAGFHSIAPKPQASGSSLCVFEYVYFARPDSMLEGQTIHRVRQRLGEILAAEAPAAADVIVGVPDSATPAAIGYATASGIPYTEGLIKNRYIGRTFIQPSDQLRRSGVHLKYNPLEANLTGKRVVLIDDSIVRGTTAGPLVTLLREGGAAEVHVRVSSPPVRHPCFMGIDMANSEELIGFVKTVEEIRDHIGADSLAYLTLDGMMRAVEEEAVDTRGHCNGCFSGNYPIDLGTFWNDRYKLAFQSAWSETGEME